MVDRILGFHELSLVMHNSLYSIIISQMSASNLKEYLAQQSKKYQSKVNLISILEEALEDQARIKHDRRPPHKYSPQLLFVNPKH